jgi:hypothetical protein
MKDGADFATWVARFEAEAARRRADGDPGWGWGACLHRSMLASIQRFQVGDGAGQIAKADTAGNDAYSAAARLVVGKRSDGVTCSTGRFPGTSCTTPLAHGPDTTVTVTVEV